MAATMHPPRPQVFRSKTGPSRRAKPATYDMDGTGPWQHMAQTYAWVADQEHAKKTRKTEEWILGQQIYLSDFQSSGYKDPHSPSQQHQERLPQQSKQHQQEKQRRPSMGQRWEEMVYVYEIEAERWMRHEEEVRRLAAEREKEKARRIQEELRKIEARMYQKREAERRRLAEERARKVAAMHEQERKERAKADKAILDAWRAYEERWTAITSSPSESLTFSSIPWPMLSSPATPENITSAGIVLFLFSPAHSQNQSRKERIRSAQLRWHPDRFRRLLVRVEERDRKAVEEGVGVVARCLNDLMAREAVASRHQ